MDRLLVHQIVSGLSKLASTASAETTVAPCEMRRLEALIDRLLTTTGSSKDSLGQVLWYCVRSEQTHQLALYLLNRLVELDQDQDHFKVASVVNCVHSSACRTALHLAADFPSALGHQLIELLLALGADALRADVHGLVPLHLAIKQLKGLNGGGGEMVIEVVIGLLLRAMIKQSKASTVEELLRKLAIIPAAIDADSALVLEVLDQTVEELQFSRRLYFEYLEYALQAEASPAVTGHLLKKLKQCCFNSAEDLSPIGLTLQYGNRRALLQAIELGFLASSRLFECGFPLLRPLLVSERNREHFPTAKRCFHQLVEQQLVGQLCKGASLSSPATIRLLGQFTTRRLTFKVLHRPAEAEVVLSGNYLSYALLKHCGHMANVLANLPLPAQFPVERDVLLPFYRFCRHDVPAWRTLYRANRFPRMVSKQATSAFFRQNCRPLYDSQLIGLSGTSADEEYALDRTAFEDFCGWLEAEEKCTAPRALSTLAQGVLVASLAVDEDKCTSGEEVEVKCRRVAGRVALLQQLLGEAMFAELIRA